MSSKSVVNSEFVDETHKSTNTVNYSVLYKSVSISICNTSSRFSYEFRHFGFTNKLTCEKKKPNFRNGGKICPPHAPTSSSVLRIVNSNLYRTATQTYDVTQRRRRAKVVDFVSSLLSLRTLPLCVSCSPPCMTNVRAPSIC